MNGFRTYLTELFEQPFPVREMKRTGAGIVSVFGVYKYPYGDFFG